VGKRALWGALGPTAGESDEQLIRRVRGGDSQAFGELYRRHRTVAASTARWLMRSPCEADDVVADAFTGVLAAIRNGNGPVESFRSYLLAAVRNSCRLRLRNAAADRDSSPDVADPPTLEDPERYVEANTVARAFASLNPRWQQVLWLTEVEQRTPAEVCQQLQLTPNAIAALTHRARQALATAYLAEHVNAASNETCPRCAPQLAAYVRGQLTAAQREAVEGHLDECSHCRQAVTELRDLNTRLRTLAPITATSLPVSTTMGASTGLLSGLLIKEAAALLLLAPLLAADKTADRAESSAAIEVNEVVIDQEEPSADEPSPAPSAAVADPTTATVERAAAQPPPAHTPPVNHTKRSAEPRSAGPTTILPAAPTKRERRATATAPTSTSAPPATTPAVPAAASPTASAPTLPPLTLPPVTIPPITVPPVDIPQVTTPSVSAPPTTLPEVTVPVTVPSVTTPPTMLPQVTVALTTVPELSG
jgi:RNA polymerase sigma factor (sigma-70 family)